MLKLDFCFRSSKFKIEGTSIYYGSGTTNNNHAVLFKLADAQIVIQPASESSVVSE